MYGTSKYTFLLVDRAYVSLTNIFLIRELHTFSFVSLGVPGHVFILLSDSHVVLFIFIVEPFFDPVELSNNKS